MDRNEVIAGIASDLYATENSVDAAIAQASTFVQTMVASRSTLSVSAIAGAGAQSKVMEAMAALAVARDAVIAAHHELAKDHRRMGWGVYAAGPVDKPEDNRPIRGVDTGTTHLRVAS